MRCTCTSRAAASRSAGKDRKATPRPLRQLVRARRYGAPRLGRRDWPLACSFQALPRVAELSDGRAVTRKEYLMKSVSTFLVFAAAVLAASCSQDTPLRPDPSSASTASADARIGDVP